MPQISYHFKLGQFWICYWSAPLVPTVVMPFCEFFTAIDWAILSCYDAILCRYSKETQLLTRHLHCYSNSPYGLRAQWKNGLDVPWGVTGFKRNLQDSEVLARLRHYSFEIHPQKTLATSVMGLMNPFIFKWFLLVDEAENPGHSFLKAANSFGELGLKREVVLNGSHAFPFEILRSFCTLWLFFFSFTSALV